MEVILHLIIIRKIIKGIQSFDYDSAIKSLLKPEDKIDFKSTRDKNEASGRES